ncbi:hypothetical protein OPT61_g10735 [Boeremia exigua]|uniref:Uncharacterized protein n=1 Tax=Boeremia exigua TaxID=749465 RepID=A0ACC2HN25_9PLEO|nr:hypothetical protein OPT61_g10735 [Boeremia exigua]
METTPARCVKAVFDLVSPHTQHAASSLAEHDRCEAQNVVTVYSRDIAHNPSFAWVVLANETEAQAAVCELNGAPFFGNRIAASLDDYVPRRAHQTDHRIEYRWGWEAAKDSHPHNVKLRDPPLQLPKDIFRPMREGRVVSVVWHSHVTADMVYRGFYMYDVECVSDEVEFRRKGLICYSVMAHFATREHAEEALHRGLYWRGEKLETRPWHIPMKYLGVSWDGGRKGGHYSGRDRGNAVGTNFESMQEEILAKAILGKNDRKLWVPSHTY